MRASLNKIVRLILALLMALAVAGPLTACSTESMLDQAAGGGSSTSQTDGSGNGGNGMSSGDIEKMFNPHGSHYTDIEVTTEDGVRKIIEGSDSDAKNSSGLNALKIGPNGESPYQILTWILNTIITPIAVIACIIRVIYVAVFPMMMQMDPLDMIDNDMWRGGDVYSVSRTLNSKNGMATSKQSAFRGAFTKGNWALDPNITPEMLSVTLRMELINAGKALLLVASLWTVINFALYIGFHGLSFVEGIINNMY